MTSPTRTTPTSTSLIGHIFTNNPSAVVTTDVSDLSISDHKRHQIYLTAQTRTQSVPFLHVQTVAVHRVSVDPGNPDCPTTGIADGHRHGVLATSVKARTPNLAALRRR